jgi:hypothetical protein
MCGLAGMARATDGEPLARTREIFEALLLQQRTRGRHATGLAVIAPPSYRYVWKKAIDVKDVMESDVWAGLMKTLPDETTVLMGHTRHATHANHDEDAAAHPYDAGRIIGAHNGMVSNWRELGHELDASREWLTDSEVTFALLNELSADNAGPALSKLKGYFALTWMDGDELRIARSRSASLAVAYVPSWKTMFWASEVRVLKATLDAFQAPTFSTWEPKEEIIYQFVPAFFTPTGTQAARTMTFKEPKAAKKEWESSYQGTTWPSLTKAAPKKSKPVVVQPPDTLGQMMELIGLMKKDREELLARIDKLEGDLQSQGAEVEYMMGILDDHGLLEIDDDPTTPDDPRQLPLPLPTVTTRILPPSGGSFSGVGAYGESLVGELGFPT